MLSHSGLRIVGACQYLSYSKLLRLATPNDAALGQLLTFFTGDLERLNEAIVGGVLLFGECQMIPVLSDAYNLFPFSPKALPCCSSCPPSTLGR